ncbi:MAG: HAMP domain-containing sensor histidine kinase [Eubacteriales bacterium]|nr:HAMP domain-containing sensor histidine kinase [Eubacteriales bacterium]
MKLKYITIIYTVIIVCCFGYFYQSFNKKDISVVDMSTLNLYYKSIEQELSEGKSRESIEKKYGCTILFRTDSNYKVALNDAIKTSQIIFDYEAGENILAKIIFPSRSDILDAKIQKQNRRIVMLAIALALSGYILIAWIYISYIRPFKTLKTFSSNIAKGNLDFPLPMTKNNYFGSFTESFDIMREELIKARENEQKANRSKKELVAELSHDMKTPIATIKATCEVTKAKLDKRLLTTKDTNAQATNTAETNSDLATAFYKDINSKVEIIEQKADMIDHLISNMFHASLEELQNLQVEPAEEPSTLIQKDFEELNYYGKIHFKNAIPECLLIMDNLRLNQVIDNVINNSYKYAGTDIEVSYTLDDERMMIEIRDFGPGVPENELPLVTEKFYRGANKTGKTGSGLGLYLASYFMEHMNGGLECFNEDGFVVRLFLPKL